MEEDEYLESALEWQWKFDLKLAFGAGLLAGTVIGMLVGKYLL